jgi:hypothetical protein
MTDDVFVLREMLQKVWDQDPGYVRMILCTEDENHLELEGIIKKRVKEHLDKVNTYRMGMF